MLPGSPTKASSSDSSSAAGAGAAHNGRRVTPKGIPTVTYARILNPPTTSSSSISGSMPVDLLASGNSVTVLDPSQTSTRHDAVQVFNASYSDQQFCESTIGQDAGASLGAQLNPVSAFVEDAATAVILILGSRNARKSQFLKKSFLPFLANELFACLEDKAQAAPQYFQTQMALSTFEVLDEVVTDLLRPSVRGLGLAMTAEEGIVVQGLSKHILTSETQLRTLLRDSCDNRASHTLPVGGSVDTSSAVWEIGLHQVQGADGRGISQSFSRLIVVDVPSVDPLMLDGPDLRQLEGPLLHKSLVCFVDVVGKLSSPMRAAVAPFRASKLTHYLSELLGGNAIVIGAAMLSPGEPEVSRKTLEILHKLGAARHYRIANRELTDIVQGLLIKFRALVVQMQDELVSGRSPAADEEHESREAVQAKIMDLQRRVAESNLAEQLAKDDCAKLFEMLELLKEKHAGQLRANAQQAEELIHQEEEKLTIARALVELKLLHNDQHEALEREKFEHSSDMLSFKNEIQALNASLQTAQQQLQETSTRLAESEAACQREHESCIELKASLTEVRKHLDRECEKTIELSAELLTLVNQRDVLNSQLATEHHRSEVLDKELSAIKEGRESNRDEVQGLRAGLVAAQEEVVRLRQQCMLTEMEVKRVTLEKEQARLEYERGASEILRQANLNKELHVEAEKKSAIGEEVANMGAYKWALHRSEAKVDELKDENAVLRQKLEEALAAPKAAAAPSPPSKNPQAQKHERLRQHIALLEVENEKMREALLRRGPANSQALEVASTSDVSGGIEGDKNGVVEGLQKRIKELESNAKEHLMKQLNEIEDRNAALTSRNALLEEELKQYRAYLKETVLQYKKQIQALRAQLVEASQMSASAPVAAPSSLVAPEMGDAVRSDKLALSPIGDGGRKRNFSEASGSGTKRTNTFADSVIAATRSGPQLRDASEGLAPLEAAVGEEYDYGQMMGAGKPRVMSASASLPHINASAVGALGKLSASRTAQGGARNK